MMINKAIKITAISFGVLLVLAENWLLFTQPPSADIEALRDLGNQYDVRIIRDAWGIPHIYGTADTDTAFGLGFAHAEDDFATIQDVVLATRGLLASAKGMDAAKTDYLINLMEIWPTIEKDYDRMVSPKAQAIASAYADGLNYYASQNPDKVLDYALPFRGADIVAGFTFKTPLFYGFDKAVGELFEDEPAKELEKTRHDTALHFTTEPQAQIGSQGIAIAPARSADGATRLLVNSHQPLTGAVAWYEARLKSQEGWDAHGATFPGAPAILNGHNQNIGWSSTVNKPDLVDIYKLEINPDNEDQYKFEGAWKDFDIRQAKLIVKLWGPFRLTVNRPVYFSAHGPVLKVKHGSYALRWAGRHELRGLDFFLRVNKAENLNSFMAALDMQAMPSINYVYADRWGNIAHFYNAAMPVRQEGWNWQNYLPGDKADLIWTEYHPLAKLPQTVNPPSGVVFNANNTPYVSSIGAGQPNPAWFTPTMGIETHMTNRATRLTRLLGMKGTLSLDEFRAVKYDLTYDRESYVGKSLQQFLDKGLPAEALENAKLVEAFNHLKEWDLNTNRENRHAALGVLTIQAVTDTHGNAAIMPDLYPSFKQAVMDLHRFYGGVNIEWGTVNRHKRGKMDLPIDGGPDILRAVYPGDFEEDGTRRNKAGDSNLFFVEWDREGNVSTRAAHNFGAATLDEKSPHYADQVRMFTSMQERQVPLKLEELLREKTRDYRP